MVPQPFPPQRSLAGERVSPETALDLLQTYLDDARTLPHLHPDARLTERGPQLAASEDGGLALHHLRRIVAGLRGERLGDVDLTQATLADLEDGAAVASDAKGSKVAQVADDTNASDWQDMDTYARAQEDEVGDIGPREPGKADGDLVPSIQGTVATPSKAERKEAKKRRHKERQREKEEQARREALAADD